MDLFYKGAPCLLCKAIRRILCIRKKFQHFWIDIVHVAFRVQENLGAVISQYKGRVFRTSVFKGIDMAPFPKWIKVADENNKGLIQFSAAVPCGTGIKVHIFLIIPCLFGKKGFCLVHAFHLHMADRISVII